MLRRFIVLGLVLSVAVFAFAGGNQESADDGAKYTIVVMPKLVGHPFYNATLIGINQAAEDLDVEIEFIGPTTPDAAEQVRMLEDVLSRDIDAIAIAPNDPAAVVPVLRRARQAGIAVLDWDTPADPSVVDVSVHQVDDNELGIHIWETLVDNMGETGDYAIITGGLSAANLNSWIAAGLAHAEANYPGLNLVTDPVPSDEQQQVAYQRALDLITAYPDLRGIVGISGPAPVGIAQAVRERGLSDEIAVVGTSLPNMSNEYLKDGSLDIATLFDATKLGYITVWAAYQFLEGIDIETGMEVPFGIGEIRTRIDGNAKVVIMGEPLDFTAENVDNFDF